MRSAGLRSYRSAERQAPLEPRLDDVQVELTHAGDDQFLGLHVARGVKSVVLFRHLGQRAGDFLLVAARLGLDGQAEHRRRKGHGRQQDVVRDRAEDLKCAIDAWKQLESTTAEARLYALSQFMAEVYAAAILCERAEWELRTFNDDRKSLVATLYTERYLTDRSRMRDLDSPSNLAIDRFDDLVNGSLVDQRPR